MEIFVLSIRHLCCELSDLKERSSSRCPHSAVSHQLKEKVNTRLQRETLFENYFACAIIVA